METINRDYIKKQLEDQIGGEIDDIDGSGTLQAILSGLTDDELWQYLSKEKREAIDQEIRDRECVPITYFQIKEGPGWSRYCDVTGGNHYALNEGFEPKDSEVFRIQRKHARKLGFIN